MENKEFSAVVEDKDKDKKWSGEVYTDKILEEMIKAFNITFRQFSMYPPDHPSLHIPVTKLFHFIESFLIDSDNLTIAIAPKRIYIGERVIKELKSTHKSFINFLDKRNIGKLRFLKGLTLDEIKEFISTVATNPNEVEGGGKIEETLSSKGLRYAFASSVDYKKLVQKESSLSYQGEEEQGIERWDDLFKDFLLYDGIHLADDAQRALAEQAQNLGLLKGLINKTMDIKDTNGTKDNERGEIIAKAITRIGQATTQEPEEIKDKITDNITKILTDIKPTIRDQVFLSKIMSLNENREFVGGIESRFSPDAIGEILTTILMDRSITNEDKIEVYNRMTHQATKRERIFSVLKNKVSSSTMTKWEDIATLTKALNLILESSGDEKFMSDSYQRSLEQIQSIATQRLPSQEEEKIFEGYRSSISPEEIQIIRDIIIAEILIKSKDLSADRFLIDELEHDLNSNIKNGRIHILEKVMPFIEQYGTGSNIDTPYSNEFRELTHRIVKSPNFKELIFAYANNVEKKEGSRYLDILPSFGVKTVSILLDLFEHLEDYTLYQPIIDMIERFYTKAIPELEGYIEKRWERIDPSLIHLLGRIGGPSRPEFILENYPSQRPHVKKALLGISHNVWTDDIFTLIKEGLKERSEDINISSLRVLGKKCDERSYSLLLQILQNPSLYGKGREFLKEVIKTCAIPGYSKAIPYLKKIFNKRGWLFYNKKREELRVISAESLATIGTKEAQGILGTGLTDKNPEMRRVCRRLLNQQMKTTDEDLLQTDISSIFDDSQL
ncbi:MAG: hypothetical protein HY999_00900 [Nitrospinae bacterium]|nr:hypothetical protein [Nitrospinota bacterium]